jgi:surface protein
MEKIIAIDNAHLIKLVKEHVKKDPKCDLNHIDVSNIRDFSNVFERSDFDGDISQWDTSNAVTMYYMFANSKFNGDISKWNVSKVKDMDYMFLMSKFSGDISDWDVSSLQEMKEFAYDSQFSCNLEKWTPYKLFKTVSALDQSKAPKPYWLKCKTNEIEQHIRSYQLNLKLSTQLEDKKDNKKIKI